MHLYKACSVLTGMVVLAGCGSGHSRQTEPTGQPEEPLATLDGRTGGPVAAAVAPSGRGLEISASGFLTLRTGRTGGHVFLWPADADLPEAFTRALAYWGNDPGVAYRWPDGVTVVGVVPQGPFLGGQPALALAEGLGLASRAHPDLEFAVGDGVRTISIAWLPDDPVFTRYPEALAFADMTWSSGGVLTGGRIGFRNVAPPDDWRGVEDQWWRAIRIAVAHEVIHASGLLGHVPPGSPGIMGTDGSLYASTDFSDAEKLTMRMHYRRPPGMLLTGTVEEEPGMHALSVARGRVIVVD